MVFKHTEQPYHDDSNQLAFQHTRQLDCGGQLAPSAYRHISVKHHIPDGVRPGAYSVFENVTAVPSAYNSGIALDNTSNLSASINSNGELVRSEHSKRPFGGDEKYLAASKRTKQVDGGFPPFSSICERSFTSVTADEELKNGKDVNHGSNVSFQWFTCTTSEEDTRLEPSVQLSFFPGYYEDHHRPARYNQLEEAESPVSNYFPRKHVALGPNHQADVPVWRSRAFQNSRGDGHDASTSSGHIVTDEDSSDKWIGHCVMPLPVSDSLALETAGGCFKTDCCCLDEGSVRCVRQHVMEVREKLRSTLGPEQFIQLGFCDMGEDVALGWTEEEEQLFHEVVFTNPVSLGKNFWDDLPHAFPSRSNKELVSYYFNVFMLRKRAEQNRSDPLNVDSDNDEWQESDDDEFGMTEEDDSGVESPAGDDAMQNSGAHGEVYIHEEIEGDDCDDEDSGVSDGFLGDTTKSKFGPNVHLVDDNLQDSTGEDQDVHDDSCTSYEGQHNGAYSSGGCADVLEGMRDSLVANNHENLHAEYRNDRMSGYD